MSEKMSQLRGMCEKAEANGESVMFVTVPRRASHRTARNTRIADGLMARVIGPCGDGRTVVAVETAKLRDTLTRFDRSVVPETDTREEREDGE